MARIEDIHPFMDEIVAIRRDLHAHPEIGMEEHRTAELVAKELEAAGIEVHRGVGGTGIVGVIRAGSGKRAIGLRADMDALPIEETSNLPYRSTVPGMMHACGHDGHTAVLLATARYLAGRKDFDGTVNLIFQPGEEGRGGAEAMLKDGLFERFPCDEIFAFHNQPGLDIGRFRVGVGPIAAGGGFFDIRVKGKGCHGAYPQEGIDPVLAACHIATGLQSIITRNLSAQELAVISVTKLEAGDAYNVIPEEAVISGTARFFSRETGKKIEEGMKRIAESFAAGMGATAEVDFRFLFAPTVNDEAPTLHFQEAAAALVGATNVEREDKPEMGSEDFSFMLEKVPGSYMMFGNGESAQLHHPAYAFNDEAIPYAAALFASMVEARLAPGAG